MMLMVLTDLALIETDTRRDGSNAIGFDRRGIHKVAHTSYDVSGYDSKI